MLIIGICMQAQLGISIQPTPNEYMCKNVNVCLPFSHVWVFSTPWSTTLFSPPVSSAYRIFQWVVISFSRDTAPCRETEVLSQPLKQQGIRSALPSFLCPLPQSGWFCIKSLSWIWDSRATCLLCSSLPHVSLVANTTVDQVCQS